MINRSIRGLLLLLAVVLGYSASVQAQIKTTTFNNNLVKDNSIVVKYDDTVISVKGKTATPKTMAADIRTELNASIGQTIAKQNVEEWLLNGNMASALQRLNRIPGVRAFPNYVFYRDELESTPVDFASQIEVGAVGENLFPSFTALYGDELIIGGDFTDSLTTNWATYLADFIPVTADIGVVNDEVAITNINGTSGEFWHVQLINEFSDDLIDEMKIGGAYEISFNARTDSGETKEMFVYFGQNFDAFTSIFETSATVTDSDSMYTFQFYLSDKFYSTADVAGMKLSLEAGSSDASLFIDNVSLRQVNSPLTAAPDPLEDSEMVISVFSDSYTNVAVDTLITSWSAATLDIDSVDGNAFLSYSNLDFVGIETIGNQLDLTEND
jgi:hypothetical protein